jgi:hypothetical protein
MTHSSGTFHKKLIKLTFIHCGKYTCACLIKLFYRKKEECSMKRILFMFLMVNMVFLGIVFSVGTVAGGGNVSEPEGEISLEGYGQSALLTITALVDERIGCEAKLLKTVAATRYAKSGKWKKMKPLLLEVEKLGAPAIIWFARPDGSYFTTEKGLVEQNIKDRPYFSKVMAGEAVVGELVVSRSTGKNVAVVAVPIESRGKIIGMAGASIFLEPFNEQIVQALHLPLNMVFYALDEKGTTALHFRREYIFQDPTKLNSPSLASAVREIIQNRDGVIRYEFEGKNRDVIYHTSSLTGWRIVLGIVRED